MLYVTEAESARLKLNVYDKNLLFSADEVADSTDLYKVKRTPVKMNNKDIATAAAKVLEQQRWDDMTVSVQRSVDTAFEAAKAAFVSPSSLKAFTLPWSPNTIPVSSIINNDNTKRR